MRGLTSISRVPCVIPALGEVQLQLAAHQPDLHPARHQPPTVALALAETLVDSDRFARLRRRAFHQ
jgi:hypothetical protein